MLIALLIIHILIALLLILSIMLQSGQAGGLGGAFGGGGGGAGAPGQSLFGGRGATDFLGKATTYLGTAFLVISFLLAFVQAHQSSTTGGRNILRDMYDGSGQSEQAPAPAQTPGVTEGEGLLPPAGGETATPQADPAAAGEQTEMPPATGGDDGSGN